MTGEPIGRAPELAAIERVLDEAVGGLSSLLLASDAGIGKTALWREGIARARTRGTLVLQSAPAESERSLTLGGLTDVFSGITPEQMASIPGIQHHALEIALLRAEPSGQLPDQRTLSVATASLLRDLATRGPLLLAIDDAQWLDESSAAILAYAIRRLQDLAIGLLLAVRGERRIG